MSQTRRAGRRDRVVVSGGAGFIGSHTVEALLRAGASVLVVDDLSHACGHPLPAEAELVRADAGSEEAARAIRAFAPQLGLHLASKGGVQHARRDPGAHVRSSLASTVAFFQACVSAGAERLVTASSGGAVYGSPSRLPTSERVTPAPLSAYGAAKLAEEIYLASFRRSHGVAGAALRYGNVYGPRQDGTGEAGVVARTCFRLLRGRPPVVFGDGGQTRDFVYVEDVARANLAALNADCSGPVNVGTGAETSVLGLVDELRRLHGAGDVGVDFQPARAGEVRRSALDASRARTELGWSTATELREGLKATLGHFKGDIGQSRESSEPGGSVERCG